MMNFLKLLLLSLTFGTCVANAEPQAQDWEQKGWKLLKQTTIQNKDLISSQQKEGYEIPEISFVILAKAGWPEKDVQKLLKEAAEVWQQCSLRFSKIHLYEVDPPRNQLSWNQFEKGSGSIFELREKTPLRGHLIVYFIQEFLDNKESSGFSTAPWVNVEPEFMELNNTIFITSLANTEQYAADRVNSPYNILAHEMLHILTRFSSHYNSTPNHLLNIWRNRTNLILPKFCEAMRSSELVRKLAP